MSCSSKHLTSTLSFEPTSLIDPHLWCYFSPNPVRTRSQVCKRWKSVVGTLVLLQYLAGDDDDDDSYLLPRRRVGTRRSTLHQGYFFTGSYILLWGVVGIDCPNSLSPQWTISLFLSLSVSLSSALALFLHNLRLSDKYSKSLYSLDYSHKYTHVWIFPALGACVLFISCKAAVIKLPWECLVGNSVVFPTAD